MPVTRSAFVSKATLPFKLTDMKAVELLLSPFSSPVMITSLFPEGGMTTVADGPVADRGDVDRRTRRNSPAGNALDTSGCQARACGAPTGGRTSCQPPRVRSWDPAR